LVDFSVFAPILFSFRPIRVITGHPRYLPTDFGFRRGVCLPDFYPPSHVRVTRSSTMGCIRLHAPVGPTRRDVTQAFDLVRRQIPWSGVSHGSLFTRVAR